MTKRAFDIVMAASGLLLAAPLLAVVAVAIRMESAGPVLYRGLRVGRYGREFRMLKLRTMTADAEQRGGTSTAADDPRMTRVGAFVRRYKLDELPQLVNVLRGDMSLVGPRPQVADDVAKYTDEERTLLSVRPGVTDYASIRFRHEAEILRGHPDPDEAYIRLIRPEKIRLGLEYVRQASFGVDMKILARTFLALFDSSSEVIGADKRTGREATQNSGGR